MKKWEFRKKKNLGIFYKVVFSKFIFCVFLVVTQNYDCYVNQAHVIRGNDVLMKCDIPSFVTDFVQLLNWQDNEENIFSPSRIHNGT